MSYPTTPTEPADTGSWPDPGEWIEPAPAPRPRKPRPTTPRRDGNAVTDVLAAAFAKRKGK